MLLAAAIGSAPGWGAFAVSVYTQRRALPRQTAQLKQHIDVAASPPVALATDAALIEDDDPYTAVRLAGALPIDLEVRA